MTALYRHFDAEGRLLYVGVSLSAVQRLAQHAASDWFADIRRIDIQVFPDRHAAERAEREAIAAEHPLHNKAHIRDSENDVPSLIAQWPDRQAFADAVGVPLERVHKWAQNKAIPSWHQAAVIRACASRGVDVSPLKLMQMHERANSPAQASRVIANG